MLGIIRLSGFLARVPLQEKLPLLEYLHNEMGDFYSVKELCAALGVAGGTFYNHIFRLADPQKYQDEKMQLMLRIKQIFDDRMQRYGASKIRAVLAGTGQQVSIKRVSSIMQELGLQSVRTDVKKFYIKLQHRRNEICCSGILLRIGPIRYGTVVSPILKSTIPVWKGAAPAEPQSQRCRTAPSVFRGQERLHCLTLERAMRGKGSSQTPGAQLLPERD